MKMYVTVLMAVTDGRDMVNLKECFLHFGRPGGQSYCEEALKPNRNR
jgi:hypothetical protein